jgi:hypothetical protein
MQRDRTSRPRVWALSAVILFFIFQFLLNGGPTESTITPCLIQLPDLYEASITELQDGLEHGHFTSVDLVKVPHCLALFLFVTALTSAHSLRLTDLLRAHR